MNVSKVSKYIISVFIGAMKYFYIIMTLLILIFFYLSTKLPPDGDIYFGGTGFSSVIFIFILGLSFFKSEFNFLQANNITRNNFFKATCISVAISALINAILGTILTQIAFMLMPGIYSDWVEGIYKTNDIFASIAWSFALYMTVMICGWIISMIYYRANKIMKIIVSFIPFVLILLTSAADNSVSGAISNSIGRAFMFIFSLNTLNPYTAALNMIIVSAVLSVFAYLLIRRMELKQ